MDKINYEDGLQFALDVIRRRAADSLTPIFIKCYDEIAAELADVQVQPERDLNQLSQEETKEYIKKG